MPHVLITGAAGGIGAAIAEAFGRANPGGADLGPGSGSGSGPTPHSGPGSAYVLSLADIDGPGLAEVAGRLDAEVEWHRTDLADPAGPEEAVRLAWESRGPVDILVNAAGIYPSLDMAEVTAAAWDRVFALNTRAPVLATAALARRVVAAQSAVPAAERPVASVVNISSGAALRARPGGGPYASSKAALETATRAAALELGPYGIRVNAVSPGFVPVDSECNPVAPRYAEAVSVNPLGRTGTPEDIARAVRWIAGAEASWVTGEVLRVDGGSATGAMHLPRLWPPGGDPAHNGVRDGDGDGNEDGDGDGVSENVHGGRDGTVTAERGGRTETIDSPEGQGL